MPDPALEEAIREAYASCPSNAIPLHTMELRHPAFMDDHGNPTAVRVVRNYEDEVTWRERGGAEVAAVLDSMTEEARSRVGLVARLESDAPVNAGQMVAFIALAFDFQLPEVSSAPVPELTVTMDNVGRELMEPLEAAATSLVRIEVTYRPYLDIDLDGPQMDPPLTMTLVHVNCTATQITARAQMSQIGNKAFPWRTYTQRCFPGLGG
ncbi:DUF1833 family protein [Magnetospirillum sp. SS-4]|uniref:DUF1833 family protein n=1 Tax=Magnetospirillum sp. SS-4 TaxID=2681465 RepID=UPI001383BE40|nr:DUF1833 family protein [Magnetospirillum sp. SS-4]CAA7618346.1 conserved hypothetical protein [Magnetospirillum sp. SS-4]